MKSRWIIISLLCIFCMQSRAVSIFDAYTYRPLISDRKASQPGDVLTVLVMENSIGQSSADLASAKKIETALKVGYNRDEHEVNFGLSGRGKATAKRNQS